MRVAAKQLFWIKALFHLVGLLPMAYLIIQVLLDSAGGDPVQYIIHYTGMGGLNALVATLLVSPIAKAMKWGWLMQTRRLIGLYVFAYACVHILAFISLDLVFAWSLLFTEIVKRPYILVGAAAFLLLLALAVTSFKVIMRSMGRRWQKLHNMIYLIALLVPIHFYWSVKSEIIEPSLYIAGLVVLLLWRVSAMQTGWRKLMAAMTTRNSHSRAEISHTNDSP